MAAATTEELERFRRQWQEEVKSRKKGHVSGPSRKSISSEQTPAGGFQSHAQPPPSISHNSSQEAQGDWEHGYRDLENKNPGFKLSDKSNDGQTLARHEPSSALEHYEKAVERESEGSLGDSLTHYRKAYRVYNRPPSIVQLPKLTMSSSSMPPLTKLTRTNTSLTPLPQALNQPPPASLTTLSPSSTLLPQFSNRLLQTLPTPQSPFPIPPITP